MVREDKIASALTAFARAICPHIGPGKTLGTVEVANATDCSDQQIRNLCKGLATPDLDWSARFTEAFGDGFPTIVDGAWNAYFGVLGRRVSRIDGGDRSFLDASGDGRLDPIDSVLHANKLGTLQLQYQQLVLAGAPGEELVANRTQSQRHLDALAELARSTPNRPSRP